MRAAREPEPRVRLRIDLEDHAGRGRCGALCEFGANVAWYLGRVGKRTIGADKLNQLRHVRFLRNTDGLLALMDRHRAIVAPKFASVIDTLERHLAGTGVATWVVPRGGYFISINVLDGCAKDVIRLATEAGVALTPAERPTRSGRTLGIAISASRRRFPTSTPDDGRRRVALSVLLSASTALLKQRAVQV